MFENFENFIYSSKENFPESECVKEKNGIFESENIYQVLYIDTRFENEKYIVYAVPYICKDEKGNTCFGWNSINSSQTLGNVENSCQFWDEYVVGFIKINEEYKEKDKALFEKYKEAINSQLE